MVITPEIYEELTTSLDYGYTFPLEIFKHFEVLNSSEEENREYQRLLKEKRKLGKGEIEAISICKNRGYVFSSVDGAALRFAEENEVEALGLHSILRALWFSGKSKNEIKEIVKDIEEKDKTTIKDVESIFS